MVDVDLVLCFSTLHISVGSVGEISTWYQWASWFVEKILHRVVSINNILLGMIIIWEEFLIFLLSQYSLQHY